MPLVLPAVVGYAVGLLAAQTMDARMVFAMATCGLMLAIGAAWFSGVRVARLTAALAVLAVAGALSGRAALGTQRRCTAAAAAARVLDVELESAAEPGGVAHALLRTGSCRLRATMFIATGRAREGDMVTVRGDVSAMDRGVVVRDAELSHVRHPASLGETRVEVGSRIDRLFGADAHMVRALVLAQISAIPAEQRDRFVRAGLVHMISASGLHLAMLAVALEVIAGVLRLPRAPARILTVLLLFAYLAAIGAPPKTARAGAMLGFGAAARFRQRPTSRWALFAAGSAFPLIDPAAVLDLGWQLSVTGVAGLLAGSALGARLVSKRGQPIRRTLVRAVVSTTVATVVTAPLVAWTFGQVPVLGPATTLIAEPLLVVLHPLLFVAIAVPSGIVERVAVDAAHALMLAFEAIAVNAAALPFAAPIVLPSVAAAIAGAVVSVAVVLACVSERPLRPLLIALSAASVMLLEPLVTAVRIETELHVIDVGQGDALAVRTRRGHWIEVDAGRSWPGGDAGSRTVVPYLAHRGGAVALFVLSHPHADHVGGAASLFAALHPARFIDPGYAGNSGPYLRALVEAARDAIPWQRVRPGDSLVVDEVVLTELAPDSAWAAGLTDANLASTILRVRVGDVRFLLTGDAEIPEEEWVLAHDSSGLAADVLKVGHHGSATSTSPRFLHAVRPRLAIISVGSHNSYGHPDREVLEALRGARVPLLRTDLSGTIVVRTDGRALSVETRDGRWSVPPD